MNAAAQAQEPEQPETPEQEKARWNKQLRDVLQVAANIDMAERYRQPGRFGELTGAQLVAITDQLDRGYLDDYIDLIEFYLSTDTKFASLNAGRIARIVERKWAIKPSTVGDQKMAQFAAEFCDEYVKRIGPSTTAPDLQAVFKNIAHALTPGFSANEMLWKIDPKRGCYMVDKVEYRHGHRFRYSPTWTLRLYDRGHRQGHDGHGEVLDPRKWIVHFHTDQAGYPNVYGIARSCLWELLFKRYAQRFRISGVERFGNPYIWMEILGDADKKVREEALRKLQRISSTQVGIVEKGNVIHFEMPGSMHAGQQPQKSFIDDANAALTERYAGTSDATNPGEHGSNAAVETRTEAQTDPLTDADVRNFAGTIHNTLLKHLCLMNWHVFGASDPSEIPIPTLDLPDPNKPQAQQAQPTQPGRVPEVSSAPPPPTAIDAMPPASPTPAGDASAEPAQFTRDTGPKAAASGEPRRTTRRSRTTSCSQAIQSAGLVLEP
jgi:phage gp29-like protein